MKHAPTFVEQERLNSLLLSAFRRAAIQTKGMEPSEDEISLFRKTEIPNLASEFGSSFLMRLAQQPAPSAPPAVELPSDGSIENAWLTKAQRMEAENALWYAKLHGIESITEALRWHTVCNQAALTAPQISKCVDQFFLARRYENISKHTLHGYHLRLNSFAKTFGDRKPASITAKEIRAYLAQWPQPGTCASYRENLSVFFNWMVRSRYILENPVAAALPRPIIKRPPGLIYTPEEAAEILKATKDNDQIGFWAMSLFAGLRVDELRNIQKLPIPWSVIDFRKGVIDLRGTQTQQFARLVTIQPVLGSWLQWIKTKNVPFFPLNHWDKLRVTRATVLANRRALSGTGGSRRPAFSVPGRRVCSIARRSYISYRMALTGVSYAHVAEDSGTTENLLRTEYYRKATKEEAERYFSLTPKSLLIST